MSGKITVRLAALAAAMALVAVLVPAGFAAGDHTSPASIEHAASVDDVLFLTLGEGVDADYFEWQGQREVIVEKKNCTVGTGPALGTIGAPEVGQFVGHASNGLGVGSQGEGKGEPCGRIDAPGQVLSVKLGSQLSDYVMSRVDLDLEYKFGATAAFQFLLGGSPQPFAEVITRNGSLPPTSGVTALVSVEAASGDDGPDSADGDNYRIYLEPVDSAGNPVYFDEISITATVGAIALEGGYDFVAGGGTAGYGAIAPSDATELQKYSSQFELVEALGCVNPVTFDLDDVLSPTHTVWREVGPDVDCVAKPVDWTGTELSVNLSLTGDQASVFLEKILFVTNDTPLNGQVFILEYDDPPIELDGEVPAPRCLADPSSYDPVTGVRDGLESPYDDPVNRAQILPGGATTCIIDFVIETGWVDLDNDPVTPEVLVTWAEYWLYNYGDGFRGMA